MLSESWSGSSYAAWSSEVRLTLQDGTREGPDKLSREDTGSYHGLSIVHRCEAEALSLCIHKVIIYYQKAPDEDNDQWQLDRSVDDGTLKVEALLCVIMGGMLHNAMCCAFPDSEMENQTAGWATDHTQRSLKGSWQEVELYSAYVSQICLGITELIGEGFDDYRPQEGLFGLKEWEQEGFVPEPVISFPMLLTVQPPSLSMRKSRGLQSKAGLGAVSLLKTWPGLFV